MAKFDVISFLKEHKINHVTSGANWSSGNVMIKCPWCSDDPSEHMGIHLEYKTYACWRNKQHRGKKIQRIVMALLGCGWETANVIVGKRVSAINQFEAFAANPRSYFDKQVKENKYEGKLKFLPEFDTVTNRNTISSRFWKYLRFQRNYTRKQTGSIIKKFNLQYCLTGFWRNRLIIPIYHGKRLVCWTGRDMGSSSMRYKTLSNKPEIAEKTDQPLAIMAPTETLFNYDNLLRHGGDTLYITEGPFDAINLDTLGESQRIRATCLFTKDISVMQRALLGHLQRKFHRICILLDRKEIASAMRLQAELSHIQPEIKFLPKGIEDPGEMEKEHLKYIL